jgi:hypothetical protein
VPDNSSWDSKRAGSVSVKEPAWASIRLLSRRKSENRLFLCRAKATGWVRRVSPRLNSEGNLPEPIVWAHQRDAPARLRRMALQEPIWGQNRLVEASEVLYLARARPAFFEQ